MLFCLKGSFPRILLTNSLLVDSVLEGVVGSSGPLKEKTKWTWLGEGTE